MVVAASLLTVPQEPQHIADAVHWAGVLRHRTRCAGAARLRGARNGGNRRRAAPKLSPAVVAVLTPESAATLFLRLLLGSPECAEEAGAAQRPGRQLKSSPVQHVQTN
jgi:hypothetical protein